MDFDKLPAIRSAANHSVKRLRQCLREPMAQKHGLVILEGLRLVDQASRLGLEGRFFFTDDDHGKRAYLALGSPQASTRLRADLLDKLTQTKQPQPVIFVLERPTLPRFTALERGKRYVLCEALQDPGNLGSMARTVEALGFDAMILAGSCVDPYNRKAMRASMGALLSLPLFVLPKIQALSRSLPWVLADLDGQSVAEAGPLIRQRLEEGFVLLMGSEAHGVSDWAVKAADLRLKIPMRGQSESLNVAAALAILAYQLSWQAGYLDDESPR